MNSNRLAPALAKILDVVTIQESRIPSFNRLYHSTRSLYAGEAWRFKKGLPRNPNAYGAITDLPDYTFLDGKRTPVGTGKAQRAKFQQELSTKIIQLSSELDFAKQRHKRLNQESEEERQRILDSKLKPKGKSMAKDQPSSSINDQ